MTRIVIAVAMPRKLGSYIDEVTPTNSIDAGKICVHISFCKTPPHECINELCSLCKPYGIAHCYAWHWHHTTFIAIDTSAAILWQLLVTLLVLATSAGAIGSFMRYLQSVFPFNFKRAEYFNWIHLFSPEF